MFKWNRKEALVFDIIFHLIVNTGKYKENSSSQGELTDVIKYAALCRITGLALSRLCEVLTTEDASPKFAYLVLRNARRLTSPDYLPNLLGTLNRDGNADSNRSGGKMFLGQIAPGNFGGKVRQAVPPLILTQWTIHWGANRKLTTHRQTRQSRLLLLWNKGSAFKFCHFFWEIQTINAIVGLFNVLWQIAVVL